MTTPNLPGTGGAFGASQADLNGVDLDGLVALALGSAEAVRASGESPAVSHAFSAALGEFDRQERSPGALPDAATVQQMANAFFSALPATGVPTGIPSAPAVPGVPGFPTQATSVPSPTPWIPADVQAFVPSWLPSSAALPSASTLPFAAAVPSTSVPAAGLPSSAALPSNSAFSLPSIPGLPAIPDYTTLVVPRVQLGQLGARGFDARRVRADFPILQEVVDGRPLVWLDNAATTQKPQAVIDRLAHFYAHENSNIHRAAHTLAARSTDAYEASRETVRKFLGAGSAKEIVFVRGATEGVNLVAQSWGRRHIQAGDEIILSWLEHHSNIVPWQQLAAERGAVLKVIPVDDSGQVLLDQYQRLLTPKTKLVAITHVSNALGTILPVAEMTEQAHRYGAKVLVDGAQAVSHMPVDVQAIGADFYVFSGHKVFGPTGIGVVYGRQDVLEQTPPWQGGGNMIVDVTFEKTVYADQPMRMEAGTGNIADAVGLGTALEYLMAVGLDAVAHYEHELLEYGQAELRRIPKLRLIGTAAQKAGVMSFVIDGLRVVDIGQALARAGVAVRAGHHCAQPALRRFGLESTVRPSLALYNTREDIDACVAVLKTLRA